MIDHTHPAVEAATPDIHCISLREYEPEDCHEPIAAALTAAFPHLTAATEDNLARLRDTPAGRALMAAGWKKAISQLGALAGMYAENRDTLMAENLRYAKECIVAHNPYRT